MQSPQSDPSKTGRLPAGAGDPAAPADPAAPDQAALVYPAPYTTPTGPPQAYLDTFMSTPAVQAVTPAPPGGPSRVLIGLILFVVGCLVGGIGGFATGVAVGPQRATRLTTPVAGETGRRVTPVTTPTVIARVTALADQARQVYGPQSGQFTLEDNTLMEVKSPDVVLHDFIATVEFTNPYEPGDYGWDYGLIFGSTTNNNEFRLYITSDGEWSFKRVDAEPPPDGSGGPDATATSLPNTAFTPLAGGVLGNWNQAVGQTNRFRLAVSGSTGYFFLNDRYVATLNLPSSWAAGDVEAGSAFKQANSKPGATVQYRDFTVWSLDR